MAVPPEDPTCKLAAITLRVFVFSGGSPVLQYNLEDQSYILQD